MVDADAEGEGVAKARVAYSREIRLDLGGGDLEELLLALVRLRGAMLVALSPSPPRLSVLLLWGLTEQYAMRSSAVSLVCRLDETNTSVGRSGEYLSIARYVGLFIAAIRGQ